ncbi:ATP-binding protein [Candidatus Roizmanbacteria bacterium]|nr:ATP-binding protein [Candidatus Roizmanbacteria bacterium]
MIIKRKLFRLIDQYIPSRQVLVVTGMRRVGKTTLLRYYFNKIKSENKIFLDLEDPFNQEIFEKRSYEAVKKSLDTRGIDLTRQSYIFLDEIQFTGNLPSVVKYLYDHYKIKFFLTGSASFYLKNLFSESLAGRKYIFELFPLDFEEFLWFNKVSYRKPKFTQDIDENTFELFSNLVEEYILYGGMPEVVLTKKTSEKREMMSDIFTSYFQMEVKVLGDFRKNQAIRNLILLLAKRVGQKVDIQRLSQELSISRQTIYEYLEFLTGTYLIGLVPAYGGGDTVVRKQKKVYFIDSGFLSNFQNSHSGSLFENVVLQVLRSWGKIYYFQKNSKEVDFIVKDEKATTWAFEVKETATASDERNLNRLVKKLKIQNSYLVARHFSKVNNCKYLFQL